MSRPNAAIFTKSTVQSRRYDELPNELADDAAERYERELLEHVQVHLQSFRMDTQAGSFALPSPLFLALPHVLWRVLSAGGAFLLNGSYYEVGDYVSQSREKNQP